MSSRVKNLLLFVLIALFVIYFIYEARNLFYGLSVTINYPPDGIALQRSMIPVEGTVKNASFVMLNGRKIYTDESGRFREELILAPGINILTLEATDRFGKTVRDIHRVVVK